MQENKKKSGLGHLFPSLSSPVENITAEQEGREKDRAEKKRVALHAGWGCALNHYSAKRDSKWKFFN